MRKFNGFLLRLLGWEIDQNIPAEAKRCVLVFAPHTSMWDFIYGRLALTSLGLNARFLIKKEMFWFPLGFFLRKMGAMPVDRQQVKRLPIHAAKLFEQHQELTLMIAPEGTRKYVEQWKKGFYFISTHAKVPIVVAFLDFGTKKGGLAKVIYPSGNYEQDLFEVQQVYRGMRGKHKGQFNMEKRDEK